MKGRSNARGTKVISQVTKWQPHRGDALPWFRHLRRRGIPCCVVHLRDLGYAVFRELRVTDLFSPDAKPADLKNFASDEDFNRATPLHGFQYRWGL